MATLDRFLKEGGIRNQSQIRTPPFLPLSALAFPDYSILHYPGDDSVDTGIQANDPILKNAQGGIYISHITSLITDIGNPKRNAVNAETLIRVFDNSNRRFKRLRSIDIFKHDKNALGIYNYAMNSSLYTYQRSMFSKHNAWLNIQNTMWKNINIACGQLQSNHFVVARMPRILPTPTQFMSASDDFRPTNVETFNDNDSMFILELWKWASQYRTKSTLNHLDPSYYNKVNIILLDGDKWCVLNLGIMNEWLQKTPKDKGLTPDELSRGLMRLFISICSTRMPVAEPKKEEPGSNLTGDSGEKLQTTTSRDIDPGLFSEEHLGDEFSKLEELRKHLEERAENEDSIEQIFKKTPNPLEQGVIKKADELAEAGVLSAAQYKKFIELANNYKTMKAPLSDKTIKDFITIDQKELAIPEEPSMVDRDVVFDKSMLKSSLLVFDSHYIKNIMDRDIVSMVMAIQNAGYIVQNYEIERHLDVMGDYEIHIVRVIPVEGVASTIRFTLPVVDETGVYMANGTKYLLRKQRSEIPIRKIGPGEVALSSYYGKVFVDRSTKVVHNYATWLTNRIMAADLDDDNKVVTNLISVGVFDNHFKCPRIYSIMSQRFRSFTLTIADEDEGNISFNLNFKQDEREKLFGTEILTLFEKDGAIVMGVTENKKYYMIAGADSVIYIGNKKGQMESAGTMETLIGIPLTTTPPVDIAVVSMMGKSIPVGVLLGYTYGFEKLMAVLKQKPRRINAGQRATVDPETEYTLKFADCTLVFQREDTLASLIIGGFNEYWKALSNYNLHDFDKPAAYMSVLENYDISSRYFREFKLMSQLFIEPCTQQLLEEMKEPVTFDGLLVKCCMMLQDDFHPDKYDSAYMRIKGYERIAGAVYSELVKSIRVHNSRPGHARLQLDFNPNAVWMNISKDTSVSLVNDINPIENLKQRESVTYSGTGGRNSRSMTKPTRAMHASDKGTISGDSVDSGDVGINIQLSANPQFVSLRGLSRAYDETQGATSVVSTSTLLAAGCDQDSPARRNFISIQNSHGISCDGYHQSPVRTGYEALIPQRTTELFSYSAKEDGKVISMKDTGMIIQYNSGEKVGLALGRIFGEASGVMYPHTVVSTFTEGQKFVKGDSLCYNSGFFEPDFFNPAHIVMKNSLVTDIALSDCALTFEDSSMLSQLTSTKMKSKITYREDIFVGFPQSVKNVVAVGKMVNAEDILCVLEDEVTANNDLFDDESLAALKILGARNAPTAGHEGKVERIEIFYNGDKEDMSDSLRAIANVSDREMAKRYTSMNRPGFTGSVDSRARFNGSELLMNTAVIRFYITTGVGVGEVDKSVFGHQMKSVTGKVLDDDIYTESGMKLGGIFGYSSIYDRVVNSPILLGTTTRLLKFGGKKMAEIYRS